MFGNAKLEMKGSCIAEEKLKALQYGSESQSPETCIFNRALGARTCFLQSGVEVLLVQLDVTPEIFGGILPLLNREERIRADRYVFERDRFRFIVGRARLRQMLAVRLGVKSEKIEFVYGKNGKPALADLYAKSQLRFNVSRSADLALYAFSNGREVGVDIEEIRAMSDADDVAERFFSNRENKCYRGLDSRNKPYGFFNCWTRKEAFVKALGDGLTHPLDSFDVSLAPGELAAILQYGGVSGDGCGWKLFNIAALPANYAGAVVFQS